MKKLHILSIVLILLALIHQSSSIPLLWPQPNSYNYKEDADPVNISPCNVNYKIQSALVSNINSIVNQYLSNVFNCKKKEDSNYTLNIIVGANKINPPLEAKQEFYQLFIRTTNQWELFADEYVGFLRGFQTYSQIFKQNYGQYYIEGIPILIEDKPAFKWRGLMIDTSRHFLPVSAIKKTITGLMYNKMNILHWHIIDSDSFPFEIPSIPELSNQGKIGGTYSPSEIQDIIQFAKYRGVRVVVEIDTPGHTESWGRSDKYKQTVVKCDDQYDGQLDPTLNLTYDLVRQVMKYTDETFQDPYIHLGGDEVELECWDRKPSIKQWMKDNNVPSYQALEIMYRQKQKQIWRNISSKKAIYWANQFIDLPVQDDDVIQWWGLNEDLDVLAGRPNQVILSNYDQTYLDVGFGSDDGGQYLTYIRWRQMYGIQPTFKDVNIIGGEACMWSELNNVHTHDQKVWIRTSVLSERFWTSYIDLKHIRNIVRRLAAHAQRMKKRGYKASAVTVELCEKYETNCF